VQFFGKRDIATTIHMTIIAGRSLDRHLISVAAVTAARPVATATATAATAATTSTSTAVAAAAAASSTGVGEVDLDVATVEFVLTLNGTGCLIFSGKRYEAKATRAACFAITHHDRFYDLTVITEKVTKGVIGRRP